MPLAKRVLLFLLFFLFLDANSVFANCEVVSDTYYLNPNSNTNLVATLKNTSENPITWIKVPNNYSSVLTLSAQSIQESDWVTDTANSDYTIYSNSNLNFNDSVHFNLTLQTGDERPMDLVWETSENPSGDPSLSCSPLSISITSNIPTPVPAPSVSSTNLSVSNTKATLSWNTNSLATGTVNYGTTATYTESLTTTSNTYHSINITNLSPSTTYHYQIKVTGEGGTTTTEDATFTTSPASVTTIITTTVTTNTVTTVSPSTIAPTPKKDLNPPTVNLNTNFSKPFLTPPTIIGKASDNGPISTGIASIEFSLDNGRNWLPVDEIATAGKKSTLFEFTPPKLDDGNYTIKIKAKDTSGNIGLSKTYTLIIDRLPPQVGSTLFSLGPMILKPDLQGNIYTITGLETKITLSAVGGPTYMDLFYGPNKFPLQKNQDTGLWTGKIKTTQNENLPIIIKSIDGANNQTEKKLNSVINLSPGKITSNNQPLPNAKVTVYSFEKSINDYLLWDATPYLQVNPQSTNLSGEYQIILPTGKYFLDITSPGKRKLRTEIFEIDNATPINQNFTLTKMFFGGSLWAQTVPVTFTKTESNLPFASELLNKTTPSFDLSTSNFELNNTTILGKYTILSFITTWQPQTSDQLQILDQLKTEYPDLNIIAISVQEPSSKTEIFKKIGSYAIPLFADPDGVLVEPLTLSSLPSHIFIDKKGIIKDISIGFLNKDDILNKILK